MTSSDRYDTSWASLARMLQESFFGLAFQAVRILAQSR
jgi:hypothetical protein